MFWHAFCFYIMHYSLQETHVRIYFGFSFPPCSVAVRAQHMELEPSWPFWPQKTIGRALESDLKLDVF